MKENISHRTPISHLLFRVALITNKCIIKNFSHETIFK